LRNEVLENHANKPDNMFSSSEAAFSLSSAAAKFRAAVVSNKHRSKLISTIANLSSQAQGAQTITKDVALLRREC